MPSRRRRQYSGRLSASQMTNSVAPIGITDCVNRTGTPGRLIRRMPCSTSSTIIPVQASTMKKAKTTISPRIATAMRQR